MKLKLTLFCLSVIFLFGCATVPDEPLQPVARPAPLADPKGITMAEGVAPAVEWEDVSGELTNAVYEVSMDLLSRDMPPLTWYREDLEKAMAAVRFSQVASWDSDIGVFERLLKRSPMRRVQTDSVDLNADEGDLYLEVKGVVVPLEQINIPALYRNFKYGIRQALEATKENSL